MKNIWSCNHLCCRCSLNTGKFVCRFFSFRSLCVRLSNRYAIDLTIISRPSRTSPKGRCSVCLIEKLDDKVTKWQSSNLITRSFTTTLSTLPLCHLKFSFTAKGILVPISRASREFLEAILDHCRTLTLIRSQAIPNNLIWICGKGILLKKSGRLHFSSRPDSFIYHL